MPHVLIARLSRESSQIWFTNTLKENYFCCSQTRKVFSFSITITDYFPIGLIKDRCFGSLLATIKFLILELI